MSGDNSRDGLHRLERDVLQYSPDIVTINFGVNDAFSGITTQQFEENLAQMVQKIKTSGCGRIVLLSCEVVPEPWAERQVLPYWDAMREVAIRSESLYVDVHGRWLSELESGLQVTDLIIPGDLHPNEKGHRLIAQTVFEAMEEHGLLDGIQP
jgi:lysophospholipase L1-like esterase